MMALSCFKSVLGGEVLLDQLRNNLFSGDEVRHGEGVQFYQAAAKKPGERRQPIDHDKGRARERCFHRGGAAGDNSGAGVHERGAGVVSEVDEWSFGFYLSG